MMLRSLVNEVVRRRLWPIALGALLIIVAAPLLFMHSAPSNAPSATSAPPTADPGKLPAGAEKLVTTSDKAVTPRHHAKGSKDPFAPPASAVKAEAAAAGAANPPATSSKGSSSGSSSSSGSGSAGSGSSGTLGTTGKVTITNSNGTTTTISTKKKASSKKTSSAKPSTPSTETPKVTSISKPLDVVNVRFGAKQGSHVRRGVPRLQTFRAGGKVAAMFVKYSPARDKAVFAIAPSTQVTGDVSCRRKAGVCRYVDIPAGKHVRLIMRAADGSIVSRRLDVVSIKRVTPATVAAADTSAPVVAPRVTPLTEAKCLLKGLLSLPAILPSLSIDACE